MAEAKRISKNLFVLLISDIFVNILSLILIVFIARFLGDVGLGKYSFAFSFVGLFTIISDFGLGSLMIREIAKDKRNTQRYFSNVLTIKLILLFIVLVLPIITIVLTESGEIITLVTIASFATVLLHFSWFLRWLIQSYELMQYESLIKILEKLFVFAFVLFALFFGSGIIGVFFGIAIAYLISALFSYRYSRKIAKFKPAVDFKFWKQLFKNGIPFWMTGVFMLILFRIDTVMLSYMKDFATVGWYNAAYKLVEGLLFIPIVFTTAIYPTMSRFYVENKKYLKELLRRAFKYLVILAIPIGIGTTMLSERIILFLYKEQFTNSIFALQILIWAGMLLFVNHLLGNFLNAINRQRYFTYSAAIAALLNIILNALLIPKYSYVGAAAATIATQIASMIFLYHHVPKSYRPSIIKTTIKPLISGILMAVFIFYFSWLALWWIIPFAAVVYFAVLFAIKSLWKEDIVLIKHIMPESMKGSPPQISE